MADAGLSQLVLARELSLPDIRQVAARVGDAATIEYFIHGALCVAFSGQCYISHAETGRSANRGDCSQACRLPYTLTDEQGRVVAYDKHLLSMKDNNQSDNLEALIDAGVRSFKIEGRYKDMDYVKNITAITACCWTRFWPAARAGARLQRRMPYQLYPNPDKTFHRGSTDYFATGRKGDIGAFDSPKFVGLPLGVVSRCAHSFELVCRDPLSNGDGLNFMKNATSSACRPTPCNTWAPTPTASAGKSPQRPGRAGPAQARHANAPQPATTPGNKR